MRKIFSKVIYLNWLLLYKLLFFIEVFFWLWIDNSLGSPPLRKGELHL